MDSVQQAEPVQQGADFDLNNQGTIFLLLPLTEAAKTWLKENIPAGPDVTYFGRSLVIEHRYVVDVVRGIQKDGLTVQ